MGHRLAHAHDPVRFNGWLGILTSVVFLFAVLVLSLVWHSPQAVAQAPAPEDLGPALDGPYGSNLLTNPGYESDTAGWTISAGSCGPSTLCPHSGSQDWDTSYAWCRKYQEVDLIAKGFSAAELDLAPTVSFSEYFRQHEKADYYYLRVKLLDGSRNQIAVWDSGELLTDDAWVANCRPWRSLGSTLSGYGAGLRYIRWEDGGKDSEGWAGNYGIVMDDASLTLSCAYANGMTNVSLNGGGNSVTVEPGATVSVSYDWRLVKPDACPGCIVELVVGFESTVLPGCDFVGQPATCPGNTGHISGRTVTAPSSPGAYYLRWGAPWMYNCTDAQAQYSTGWTAFGTIIVANPTATPTRTATRTRTRTATYTQTRTPVPGQTNTRTSTPTSTSTATVTSTPAESPTVTPTPSLTPTRGPSPTPTRTPVRNTRHAGVIDIAAVTFTDLGGGQTRATGSVVLNDNFYLSGVADEIVFTSSSMTGHGTLATTQGQVALFTGDFSVNVTTGILTQAAGVTYNLSQVSGFSVSGPTMITRINVLNGVVKGSTTLSFAMPGASGTANVDFTIDPGPVYSGTMTSLDASVAGIGLSAPVDGALTNTRLTATGVTLTGPADFGGKTVILGEPLKIGPSMLALGSGSTRFAFPALLYGGLQVLKLTNNQALLKSDAGGYYWEFSSVLNANLPYNTKSKDLASVALRGSGLTGNAGNMNLDVAALTLQLNNLALSNTGLTPANASITLPAGLGGDFIAVSNVGISKDGLTITGTVDLPDIDFGGSSSGNAFLNHVASLVPLGPRPQAEKSLTLKSNKASLIVEGSAYGFSVASTAEIKLPGNDQTTDATFTIKKSGSTYLLSGTLSAMSLTLAGSTLSMEKMTISNTGGLTADAATLKLPESLGETSITVNNISITSSGLSVGGGSITLPTIKIGDGSKLQVVSPTASITAVAGGYTFGVSGTLQLRLPQNNQDIPVSFTIGANGQFTCTITKVSLTVATATLALNNAVFNNSGLSVGTATLTLPAAIGGASGTVNDVRITGDGLRIGSGSVTFPFPDFKLGGETTGFNVTGVTATLDIAGDGSYKISLTGTVAIQIPGAGATVSGTVGINSSGQFSGSLSGFSLTVAGLSLDISSASISSNGTVSISSAKFTTPAGFGGLTAEVYNLTITKSGGVSIGGGSFTLPKIKAGGYEISASGKLVSVTNPAGYEITAGGSLKMPDIGAGGGCSGISVSLALFASTSGNTVLLIRPEGEVVPQAEIDSLRNPLAVSPADWPMEGEISSAAAASLAAVRSEDATPQAEPDGDLGKRVLNQRALRQTPDPQDFMEDPSLAPELSTLRLKNITLSLTCEIPIGNTGLFLTSIRGSITLNEGSTTISVGLTVAAGKKILGTPVLSADADATITTSPFKLVIDGTVKLFIFTVGGAHAEVSSAGFKATLWMNLYVASGSVTVQAWSSMAST
jgi:hypothetical protein